MPSPLEQWAFDNQWPLDDEDRPRCLECGNFDYEGHTEGCDLGLALSDAGFPVEWYIGPLHGPWQEPSYRFFSELLNAALSSMEVPSGMSASALLLDKSPLDIGLGAVNIDRVRFTT